MHPFVLPLLAHGLDVQIHQHSAYQLVFSLGVPFYSVIGGVPYQDLTGFLIKPQVSHLCTVDRQTTLCIINVEPYSRAGLWLSALFGEGQSLIVLQHPADMFRYFPRLSALPAVDWPAAITATLTRPTPTRPPDGRVQTIIHYLETHYTSRELRLPQLAGLVFLSPSRLAALFRKETGSSISKYLLWTRLRHALRLALAVGDRSLTEIAHETGFYDQAQMNKYMTEMMGGPPRVLRQNSHLIQVPD